MLCLLLSVLTLQHGKMARLDSNPTERLVDLFHIFLVLNTIQPLYSHVSALDSHNQGNVL